MKKLLENILKIKADLYAKQDLAFFSASGYKKGQTHIELYSIAKAPHDFWFEIIENYEKEYNMKEVIVEPCKELITYKDLRKKHACKRELLKALDHFGEDLHTGVHYKVLYNYIAENMNKDDLDWFVQNFYSDLDKERYILFEDINNYIEKDGVFVYKNKVEYYFLYFSLKDKNRAYLVLNNRPYILNECETMYISNIRRFVEGSCKLYWFPSMKDAVEYIEENKEELLP